MQKIFLIPVFFTASAIALWSGFNAIAQDRLSDRFKQYDANSDGKVTAEELKQDELFSRLDLNQDGSVTMDEARKGMAKAIIKPQENNIKQAPGMSAVESVATPAAKPTNASNSDSPVRQGPKQLVPGDHGIGSLVADIAFEDLNGKDHQLSHFANQKAIVIAMTSTSCPLSKKYLPTLVELANTYSSRGVTFVLVNSVETDKDSDMQSALDSFDGKAVYTADDDRKLTRAVKALSTTDVIVIDPSRTVAYHGAIDDQYGFGYSIDEPKNRYLADAIDAILTEKSPLVSATAAPGCVLETKDLSSNAEPSTYHGDISRLFQRHCVECHREGGVGPFALDSYKDVIAHAPMIKDVIERGVMPPWFAAPSPEGQPSIWANDRSLAATEKTELLSWLDGSHPIGDAQDAPKPRSFVGEWTIGKPDLIVQLPKPMSIKATGTMPYQFVTAQTTLAEDRWVQAYEIVPTDRSVVHHVIVNVHEKGSGRIRDLEEGLGGYWAAYVPGNTMQIYPPGFGRKLPAGATVSFQIHYTPSGKATSDQLRMGLIFTKEPPKYAIETLALADRNLNIPPRDANHVESYSRHIRRDINVLAYLAHMHVRGKAFRFDLTTPDGKTETLLDIPNYDFNWQLRYDYAEPRVIPAGSTVKVSAVFDNSTNNPANPDADKTVRWGPQTFDEMMIGYVETYRDLSVSSDSSDTDKEDSRPAPAIGMLFNRMDKNGDGKLTEDEIPGPQKRLIMRLDNNQDGEISLDEAERLKGFRRPND